MWVQHRRQHREGNSHVTRLNDRKFGREPILNAFWRVVSILDEDSRNVFASDENDRMTVFSHLLVPLRAIAEVVTSTPN